jgi:ribonuclease VapC
VILFVDASALVSMAADESDSRELAAQVRDAARVITSAVAHWEAVIAVHRSHKAPLPLARELVASVIRRRPIEVLPLNDEIAHLALDAFERFGKGNHPARLNMGDCFAWACAKAHGAKLLYKGDDFALTDLA